VSEKQKEEKIEKKEVEGRKERGGGKRREKWKEEKGKINL
jgi:hypothetical protein